MVFSTETELRKAIRIKLLSDDFITSQLGGGHVFDDVPRAQAGPYVVFTQSESRDWSTMTDKGVEHLLTLEVWSQKPGAREALEIAGRIAEVLHESELPVSGASCVHARVVSIETQRQGANRFVRARLRLRALIELE